MTFKKLYSILLIVLAGVTGLISIAAAASADDSLHSFKMESLALEPMDFNDFNGKVVLLVNTASFCGYTPQYKGLQKLYDTYKDDGLVIVGVPANDFNKQEPGTNEEIKEFCEKTYQVKFPMTDKLVVVGEKRHKLYAWLASQLGEKSAPRWNFHKYLIGKDGQPITYFSHRTKPQNDKVVSAIKAALAK